MPPEALASFAGVAHMLDLAAIEPGDRVLDLGSGSGTDAFIAAHLAGSGGRVVGVDMTDAQLVKARRARDERGLKHVTFVRELIERTRRNVVLWAACIAGAVPQDDYLGAIEAAGLRVETVRPNPAYRFLSPRAQAAADKYGVASLTVLARVVDGVAAPG